MAGSGLTSPSGMQRQDALQLCVPQLAKMVKLLAEASVKSIVDILASACYLFQSSVADAWAEKPGHGFALKRARCPMTSSFQSFCAHTGL